MHSITKVVGIEALLVTDATNASLCGLAFGSRPQQRELRAAAEMRIPQTATTRLRQTYGRSGEEQGDVLPADCLTPPPLTIFLEVESQLRRIASRRNEVRSAERR